MVIWSYGHLVIWSSGHLVIWSYGHMVNIVIWSSHKILWSYGHQFIWSSCHLIIWSIWLSVHLFNMSSGHLVIWLSVQYVICSSGHLVIWSSGHLVVSNIVKSCTILMGHLNKLRAWWFILCGLNRAERLPCSYLEMAKNCIVRLKKKVPRDPISF